MRRREKENCFGNKGTLKGTPLGCESSHGDTFLAWYGVFAQTCQIVSGPKCQFNVCTLARVLLSSHTAHRHRTFSEITIPPLAACDLILSRSNTYAPKCCYICCDYNYHISECSRRGACSNQPTPPVVFFRGRTDRTLYFIPFSHMAHIPGTARCRRTGWNTSPSNVGFI